MMSTRYLAAIVVVALAGGSPHTAQALPPPPPRLVGEGGVLVLTRGPVHEAFAETVTFDAEPGILVPMAPPRPIDEVPPDQRPEGADVTWIPGYTAWDDERQDYLWVSGVWRAPPPGRQWMSGYWGRAQQGFQWTSGYWADAEQSEVEYLPEPPKSVEIGPSAPAPTSDQSWIPGSWMWQNGRYAWRPGFWVDVQSDWDWIPAHYTWTPRGYVFVDGYWDYGVTRRGVLFAPMYFDADVYRRRGYYYSPSTVISLNVFSDHLFVRPRYRHYYFGDYYDGKYQDAGFYSRHAFQISRRGYEPIYVHQRWRHRQDPGWEVRVDAEFRHRRDHREARPPRTLGAQLDLDTGGHRSRESGLTIAASLDQLVGSKDSTVRFRALDKAERQRLVQRGREVRRFREGRRELETHAADRPADERSSRFSRAKVVLPRSPIVARRPNELGKDRAPPTRHKAPAPDPTVEARAREARDQAGSPKVRPRGERESAAREPGVRQERGRRKSGEKR